MLDKRRAAVKEGTPDPSQVDRITVNELLADLEKHYELHEQPSLSKFKVHAKTLLTELTGVRVSAITYGRLLKLAEKWLAAGKSKATCNRRLAALRRAYRLARRDERVTRIPAFPHFSEGAQSRSWPTWRRSSNIAVRCADSTVRSSSTATDSLCVGSATRGGLP